MGGGGRKEYLDIDCFLSPDLAALQIQSGQPGLAGVDVLLGEGVGHHGLGVIRVVARLGPGAPGAGGGLPGLAAVPGAGAESGVGGHLLAGGGTGAPAQVAGGQRDVLACTSTAFLGSGAGGGGGGP